MAHATIARRRALEEHEALRIAEEAYIYLYPLVLMEMTRRVSTNMPAGAKPGFGPPNVFSHMRTFPPGDFKEVVGPNFDTLYSPAWLDLRDGPVVVSAADTGGRYYMLPMLDMWTDVFTVVGSRTTGTEAGDYAVVPAGWRGELPADVVRIEAPTPVVWIIGRTQTNGPSDYDAVHQVQDGFAATPLAHWPDGRDIPEVAVDSAIDMQTPPLDQVNGMSGEEYFAAAMELLQLHPPHIVDQPVLARMRRLGLEVGEPLDPHGIEEVLDTARAAALPLMHETVPRLNPVVDGWSVSRSGMGVYGTDYLRRAVIAMIGLGANLPEDAVYPMCVADEDGAEPSGDHDYVLRFEADELPPVEAFWSVTMYDAESFPVPNPLDRYALGDRDPLSYREDGSLELYLQHESPGAECESNWLPTPQGPLRMVLRLYGPRPEVLDGRWSPPPLRRR